MLTGSAGEETWFKLAAVNALRAARLSKCLTLGALIGCGLYFSSTAIASEKYDYRLGDLDGVEYRASDSLGKWLVINFWATWCAPCLEEMPELEKFHREHGDIADLWGVSFEDTDVAKIREFVARLGVTYPILGHGQDPKTGFGIVRVLPTTFVIDPEGKFHHRFEGPITADDLLEVIDKAKLRAAP